jgi:hypothetical protein
MIALKFQNAALGEGASRVHPGNPNSGSSGGRASKLQRNKQLLLLI